MRNLETNDWLVLNSIIYKIHTIEDFDEMRRGFLSDMKLVLDFDSADFYLAETDGSNRLRHAVVYNGDKELCQTYEELDYSRGIMYAGKSTVYRETDIISDEVRVETEYYKKVYKPNKWHYALQMILGMDQKFLGVVTFYRNLGREDFTYEDVFLVDMLKEHMAYRLSKNLEEEESKVEKLTVTQASEKYDLTRRESTILHLLMEGRDNIYICSALTISENTLKKHILNLYRKLGIRNRVQLFKMIREKE